MCDFFLKTKTVLKNVATCLFDNWIPQQRERQGGQMRHTHCTVVAHTLYCGCTHTVLWLAQVLQLKALSTL